MEKVGSFGGEDMVSFWYKHPGSFAYDEVLKVRLHCEMDFQHFPFDNQDCFLKLRNWLGAKEYVQLNQPKIFYDDTPATKISVDSKKLNFHADLWSSNSKIVVENSYGYSQVDIHIKMTRNKIGFDKIVWGYYVTTWTFSAMSHFAFFVDPSMVRTKFQIEK